MSHGEREIVPDRGTSERKGTLSLIFLVSFFKYEICEYPQRSRECIMGCMVQGGQKGMEEQCK